MDSRYGREDEYQMIEKVSLPQSHNGGILCRYWFICPFPIPLFSATGGLR